MLPILSLSPLVYIVVTTQVVPKKMLYMGHFNYQIPGTCVPFFVGTTYHPSKEASF